MEAVKVVTAGVENTADVDGEEKGSGSSARMKMVATVRDWGSRG
jgi:hypothetical protein